MSEPRPRRTAPRGRRSVEGGTIARHGRLPRSGPWRSILKLLAASIAVVVVSAVSIAAIATWDVSTSFKKTVHLVDASGNPVPEVGAIDGAFNILLVGTDTRSGQGAGYGGLGDSSGAGLNDVTMLLHVSKNHQQATVVSFPRDMFVPIPSCPNPKGGFYSAMSSQKINTTLSYGGLSCTVLTVEKLTGMSIPYAAEITFDGVIKMSDAVGGVPVCVSGTINDPNTNLHLTAGEHTLKGEEALQFLRTRHGVGDGSDLGRISNQQLFLSSMVRTVKSAQTLANPAKVYALAKAAASSMTLTDSLNISTLVSMAVALKNVDLGKVVFVQYPNAYVTGGVAPIPQAADTLFTALKNDKPITITGGTGAPGVGSVVSTPTPKSTDSGASTSSASSAPTSTSTPSTGSADSSKVGTSTDSGDGKVATPSTNDAVTLPDTVHGQTANEKTCSRAFDF